MTLQATALVHEAYLRLVNAEDPGWNGRGHFFAAAAEAMRRILVEDARRKRAEKNGGGWVRNEFLDAELAVDSSGDDLFAVDEALARFNDEHPLPPGWSTSDSSSGWPSTRPPANSGSMPEPRIGTGPMPGPGSAASSTAAEDRAHSKNSCQGSPSDFALTPGGAGVGPAGVSDEHPEVRTIDLPAGHRARLGG